MKPIVFFSAFFAGFLSWAGSAKAAGIWDSLENCRDTGTCELSHFLQLAINISYVILGLTGSLALLAFIYGGVLFLFSAGSREWVEQGRRILIGAVIGLAIVFFSYTVILFVLRALGAQESLKYFNN